MEGWGVDGGESSPLVLHVVAGPPSTPSLSSSSSIPPIHQVFQVRWEGRKGECTRTHDTGAYVGEKKEGNLLLCMYVGKDISGFAHVWRKEGSERDCRAGEGREGEVGTVLFRVPFSLSLPPPLLPLRTYAHSSRYS